MKSFLKGIAFAIASMLFVLTPQSIFSQNDSISGRLLIEYYLKNKQVKKADSVLKHQIAEFIDANQIDSLYQFPLLIGKIAILQGKSDFAAKNAINFIEDLNLKTTNARTLFKAHLSLDKLYLELGDDMNCVASSKKALEYAKTLDDVKPEELGKINYIIGGNYYALYDLSNAVSYFKTSAKAYEESTRVKKHILADSYNGIAVSMWTLRKLDSAKIYFNKAIDVTEASDLVAFKRLYYISTFKFNLALVFDDEGNISEAIRIKKDIIPIYQSIIDGSDDPALVKKSKRMLAMSFSNLAALYNDAGYTSKAYNMLKYAYEKKKEVFEIDNPSLTTTLNQIALAEIQQKEFDKSLKTTQTALANLKQSKNKYLAIEADILYMRAKAYSGKKDSINALKFYQESERIYTEAYPVEYSRDYIILLRNYSLFLANQNEKEKAISKAKKIYDYILKNGKDDNFLLLKEIVNLSEIHYITGDYKTSQYWAEKGNTLLDTKIKNASSAIDSIKIELNRPDFLLLECKSKYELAEKKDQAFLIKLTSKLDQAINLLEKRKTTLFNQKDVSELFTQYKSITALSKQLHNELFIITNDEYHLNKTIELHESSIYNRIRSRLNLKNNISFKNIPKTILEREKRLKENLSLSGNDTISIVSFFKAENHWNSFLDSIKQTYPKYYKMRYATIETPLNNLQKTIPINTTVVRYLFIDDDLYAFIVSQNSKQLFKLDFKNVQQHISQLSEEQSDIKLISTYLNELYKTLWLPFETKITTDHVIIIPDGELFNLSFETLTPQPITAFSELATNSLLANHSISYNYSLLLLDEAKKTILYDDTFIAFAPEFNDKMKEDYKISISDSISVDKTYLNLIPQPFSVDLVKEYSKLFRGNSFINENASKTIFTNEANEHKIIHIGTHAESNNVSPELSRLIFAKNNSEEDNSLYTYEIYNQNLNSNLAILTACETGKPTYQAGEGMISLAHAFNYAGSESILTSLWKIDEQSSTGIIKLFYDNLALGLPKDKALQNAKLSYIASAQGRTKSPQYWAGLVLIGDNTPIEIKTASNFIFWLMGILCIILIVTFIRKKRRG